MSTKLSECPLLAIVTMHYAYHADIFKYVKENSKSVLYVLNFLTVLT